MRESRTHGSQQGTASNGLSDSDRTPENVYLRVNNYYLPPSAPTAPAQEPLETHTTGSETTTHYDAVAAGREAQLPATEYRRPPGSSLCPPPKRMTAQDGCQN